MTIENENDTEALLLETLLSGLDARESAKSSGSHLLIYLADMLVQRARDELDAVKAGSPAAVG